MDSKQQSAAVRIRWADTSPEERRAATEPARQARKFTRQRIAELEAGLEAVRAELAELRDQKVAA